MYRNIIYAGFLLLTEALPGHSTRKAKIHLLLLATALVIIPVTISNAQVLDRITDKRMAAHHYSVVCTGTDMPSSAILTYPVNEFRVQDYNFLLKLMPCLEFDGKTIFPSDFEDVKVEDFPGGVKAVFSYADTRVVTRITPLLSGRGSESWKGAVLYEVETQPTREVLVYLGGAETINLIWGFETSVMKRDSVFALEEVNRLNERSLQFLGGKENLYVGVSSSDPVSLEKGSDQTQIGLVRMPGGSGHILTVFSEVADDLPHLIEMDVKTEKGQMNKYYQDLMGSSIETPEEVMNKAFASAIYNLEYSWIEPFGWGECLHHWLALWYMQVTPAAELLGQEERSRSCILEHGNNQFENGAIPMLNPNHQKLGMKRRDWGGANTYWVWQIRHYVNYTGDKEFARQIIPYVDRAIQQTLEEYDPDGNLLIAWGLQIGNQEDFVANPYDGSVPTMELYNMFMTRAELAEFTGDGETATHWFRKAEQVKQVLYRDLWLSDLGRFAYYKDPTGRILLDGQYQTYLYPVIYDLVDQYDQYSGIRHSRDRLTDVQGAVFASNNFAWHVPDNVSTWGMQRGAAQQPWAAMGFSKAGLNNLAWRPLKTMAEWAQDPRRPGAWPETGPEPTPAYFTPPAGLYISTITEALFGLNVYTPKGYIEVSPSFPDHWPEAKLNLPDFQVAYTSKNNRIKYVINTTRDLPLKVNWQLPVSDIKKCKVNNRDVPFEVTPGVDHIILTFDAPASDKTTLNIEFEPVEYSILAPYSIAQGETLSVSLEGANIERIVDRYGVLESTDELTPTAFAGIVQNNLLDPYQKFNQLGQLNFSRRTLFADCKTPDGIAFIAAIDLNILPRIEACPHGDIEKKDNGFVLPLKVRNNTSEAVTSEAAFEIAGTILSFAVDLPARSEQVVNVFLPAALALTSGENNASLSLPGVSPLDVRFQFRVPDQPGQFMPVMLSEKDMIPDTLWNELRIMPGFPHIFFTFSTYGWPKPMEALENVSEIAVPEVPGLTFKLAGQKFIPVSHLSGQTSYKLPLDNKEYRKLYLLVLPFVDNHDIFSDVARVSVYSNKEMVYGRTLSYPGDVDYWVSNRNPTSFASLREPRVNPYELLPLLSPEMRDWDEGKPPDFPQSIWWSTSIPVATESCVMSIIEINLGKSMELNYLVFEALGALPAFGIVAVSAEIPGK